TALLVLSQSLPGPQGYTWCEPGATVVSEAAACGTPVIASMNGCLPEIVPGIGTCLSDDFDFFGAEATLASLPPPWIVRARARRRWDHRQIAKSYLQYYHRAYDGVQW